MIKVKGDPIEWRPPVTEALKKAVAKPSGLSVSDFSSKRRSSTTGWEPVTKITENPVTENASRKRGRPKKENALSVAERARAYRERKRARG